MPITNNNTQLFMPCLELRLSCKAPIRALPLGYIAEPLKRLGPCMVSYALPRRCVVTYTTRISYTRYTDVRVKPLEKNYLIEIRHYSSTGDVKTEYLVYPRKVWEIVENDIIDPLAKGYELKRPGAVFVGPPGTGKTSMAKLIAEKNNLYVVLVSFSNVVSPYIGETAKNMAAKFREAEQHQPSELLFDDGEWAISSRFARGPGGDAPGSGKEYLGMANTLLNEIDNIVREKKRVVVIVTTNAPETMLDKAIIRSGRLGSVIRVPKPNEEAVRVMLELTGATKYIDDVDALVSLLISSGLSMADVVNNIAVNIIMNKGTHKLHIEPDVERGYVRPVPPKPLSRDTVKKMLRDLEKRIPCSFFSTRYMRAVMYNTPLEVAEPIIVSHMTFTCAKPVIILTNPTYYTEALAMAEMSDGVLVVDADMIDPGIIKQIHLEARCPIIYVTSGSTIPVMAYPLPRFKDLMNIGGPNGAYLASLILNYYGIEHSVHELTRITEDRLRSMVEYAKFFAEKKLREISHVFGVRVR